MASHGYLIFLTDLQNSGRTIQVKAAHKIIYNLSPISSSSAYSFSFQLLMFHMQVLFSVVMTHSFKSSTALSCCWWNRTKHQKLRSSHWDIMICFWGTHFHLKIFLIKQKQKTPLTDAKLRMVFLHFRKFVIQWFVIYTGAGETDRK